jgi:methionine aminopeptidase
MVELKTESEIEAMSAAGAVMAEALRAVVEHATLGCTTAELDEVAAEVLARHGAGHRSSTTTRRGRRRRSRRCCARRQRRGGARRPDR